MSDVRIQCPRHVVITVTPRFKARVLAKKKLLANLVDPQGYKYFVSIYLPQALKAAQIKHRPELNRINEANNKRTPENQQKAKVVGCNLVVDNKTRVPIIKPPTPGEICKAFKRFKPELDSFDLLCTQPLFDEGNVIQGFAVRVGSHLGISLAYMKAKLAAPSARHVMCAYEVAGLEDSCDDEEDHAGLLMSTMLQKGGYKNIAIFISCQLGPDQMGPRRFDVFRKVVYELFQILDASPDKTTVDGRWRINQLPPIPPRQPPTAPPVPIRHDPEQTLPKRVDAPMDM